MQNYKLIKRLFKLFSFFTKRSHIKIKRAALKQPKIDS